VVTKKKTKIPTNAYEEKPKVGWLRLGIKILQLQPIDEFVESVAFGRGHDVGAFSEAMLDYEDKC
jgi:hypothetical protein